MKKISIIVLVIVGLMFAAYAEAAKPKRRTRNANRIGPYAGILIGQDHWTSDQSEVEAELLSTFVGLPTQNQTIDTKDTDIGYQASFGYRFSRYAAAELALIQYGNLSSQMRADVDGGAGFVPVSIKLNFSVGGPLISGVGILPLGEHFEVYGRGGVLFASSEREITSRIDGDPNAFGSAKGDSTELVLGLGFAWHINQMYSVRGEFQRIDELGDEGASGVEDLSTAALGFIVRF